jgi:hypothetical protein
MARTPLAHRPVLEKDFGKRQAAKLLDESVHVVDEAIAKVQALALDLRPSVLDDLGLVSALRRLLEQHAQRAGIGWISPPALRTRGSRWTSRQRASASPRKRSPTSRSTRAPGPSQPLDAPIPTIGEARS